MIMLVKYRIFSNITRLTYIGLRNVLSQAYMCEVAWEKRLENPLLRRIKMNQYFVEIDKKFNTKELASGVDIDLFANNVQLESQLDELEHLLYRFRRTKRSTEMMDSTTCAAVRIFLKYKQYESLMRILSDRENYGAFPDFYTYNILMDRFLKEKLYKEATSVAILMMLQEEFSNKISCLLALYSCQMFLNEHPVETLFPSKETTEEVQESKEDEDEDEVTLVRVPFLPNPWFDDHFDLKEPRHLIGKTFYLVGRNINDELGRSYQLLGLGMYEKWEKAFNLLQSMYELKVSSLLLSESVEKFKECLDTLEDQETKNKWLNKFEEVFQKFQKENKIKSGDLMTSLKSKLDEIPSLEAADIKAQEENFLRWEEERKKALDKQNLEIEKKKRWKAIEEKKEYLYWKEKLLFFFENEGKNLDEFAKVEEMVAELKTKKTKQEVYEPPEIVKKPLRKLTIYEKLANVKKIQKMQ